MSQLTCFGGKKGHGGPLPEKMRRLKTREHESTRLKTIISDLTLDREMI